MDLDLRHEGLGARMHVDTLMNTLRPADLDPAYLTCLSTASGEKCLVYVEARASYQRPSRAEVRVTVFHPDCVGSTMHAFSVGPSADIESFGVVRGRPGLGDLLVVDVSGWEVQGREYYAVSCSGTRLLPMLLTLVRAEVDGAPFSVSYDTDCLMGNALIGPRPEVVSLADTPAEWLGILSNGSKVHVLSALLYLAGARHPDPILQTRFQEVRNAVCASSVLASLLEDEDSWVRDAAALLQAKCQGKASP